MISLFLTLADELISHSRVISRPGRVVIGKASGITNDFNLFNYTLSCLECVLPQITYVTHGDDDDYEGIIFTANLRGRHIVGRKEEGRNRLTANSGNNVKSGPKYHNYHSPREESIVRRRRFSMHVICGGGGRANRALNRFYRAITVRAIVRHYLETSLSILHGRVWMKEKKISRASTCLLASYFVVFGELCSCS